MSANPTPPSSDGARRRLTAPDALADVLTAGYGRVLELEAHRAGLAREIDELLAAGDESRVLGLARLERELSVQIDAQRATLDRLSARRRSRRQPEAGAQPPGPSPAAS